MIESVLRALRHPLVFLQGFREGGGAVGMTWDDDPNAPRSIAYDVGRELRQWISE